MLTDSAGMYGSRLKELHRAHGAYTESQAGTDLERHLRGAGIDHLRELGYYDRKALHNLKYFTWVEQQGMTVEELNAQWFDRGYWDRQLGQAAQLDAEIRAFNEKVGLSS